MKKLPSINKTTNIVEQLKAGLPPASIAKPLATSGRDAPMQAILLISDSSKNVSRRS